MKSNKGYSITERNEAGRHRRFVVAFRPSDGGQRWPTRTAPKELRTRAAVARWAEGQIALGEAALPSPRRPEGPTVRSVYQEWWLPLVEKRPGLQPATLAGYRSAFGAVLLPMLGDSPVTGLDAPHLITFIGKLRERTALAGRRGKPAVAVEGKKISPSRVCNVFSALSMFLSDAVANKKVPFSSNPAADPAVLRELPERPRPKRVHAGKERPGCAPLDDVQAVISCVKVAVAIRVQTMIIHTSALRCGELAGLRVRSVLSGATRALDITEAVKLHGPKGHATPGDLKTTSSERVIPLHPAGAAALDEWIGVHLPRILERAPRPEDFLFPRADGGPSRPKLAMLFRAALAKAGRATGRGGQPVTAHRARHMFASALAEVGVPHEVRSLLLGHAAASVTEAHYTEHGLAQLAVAVAKIPLTWPGAASASAPPSGDPERDAPEPSDACPGSSRDANVVDS